MNFHHEHPVHIEKLAALIVAQCQAEGQQIANYANLAEAVKAKFRDLARDTVYALDNGQTEFDGLERIAAECAVRYDEVAGKEIAAAAAKAEKEAAAKKKADEAAAKADAEAKEQERIVAAQVQEDLLAEQAARALAEAAAAEAERLRKIADAEKAAAKK